MYDIFYLGNNELLTKTFPFAKKIKNDFRPLTKMYWLVEENVEVIDYSVFDYRPETHDEFYEHVWKWNPENYGGLRLIPKQDSQGIKEVNKIVCKKTYDILYSKTPRKYFEDNPNAKFVWCVDKEYVLPPGGLNWAPDNFEPDYIHNFKLPYQALDKYPKHEGGINLYPKDWHMCDTKYHGIKSFGDVYPYIYVNDPEDYSQRDMYDDDFVWLIDKNYVIDESTLTWVPPRWERQYIHSFKIPTQLKNKTWSHRHFEENKFLGGIRLVPKNWRKSKDLIPGGVVIHKNSPVRGYSKYDVFYIDDFENEFNAETYSYYAERCKTDYFWIVDREYDFTGALNYVQDTDDRDYILVFKIPGMLEHRYPISAKLPAESNCGGVRLVPKNFDMTKQKYIEDTLPINYDIFYVPHAEISDYEKYQPLSTTSMFVLVDQDHVIDASKLTFAVPRHERYYSTIFKIPGQLDYRYVSDQPWDNRCGGVHFVPKHDVQEKKYGGYIGDVPTESYPIVRVSDPKLEDLSESLYGPIWVVDSEYILSDDVFSKWTPNADKKDYIHNFNHPTQLNHKYPEEMGGIFWLPHDWQKLRNIGAIFLEIMGLEKSTAQLAFGEKSSFPMYKNIEEGMAECTDEYFWVVDSDVDVFSDFKFDYVPEIWDRKQTHIWQKLNPVTGKVFDYGGVQLVCVNPSLKKRPKFLKVAASTQKPFPIFEIDPSKNLAEQLSKFSNETREKGLKNFWLIDPKTKLVNEWDYSFLPTQWEQDFVHVFENELGEYSSVRLLPVSYVEKYPDITLNDFTYNDLPDVKFIQTVASTGATEWPVISMDTFNKEEFIRLLGVHKKQGFDFAWTIDSDCIMLDSLKEKSFMPALNDRHKVHMWQIFSPHTDRTHSYGGIKLWPTDKSYKNLTTKEFNTGSMRDKQYIREQGGTFKPYDVVLITYHDDDADEKFEVLKTKCSFVNAVHVKDIDGIFEAHKEAAYRAKTKMFWVVDGDAELLETFKFDYIPDIYDRETVHVWTTKNPITGSEYGYGGVKLFNRQQILDATNWGLDFTTGLSKDFKVMDEVSNITKFNTSPLSTWRSAFREAAKLTLRSDSESLQRLFQWFDPPNKEADYCEYAINGAEEGYAYIIENSNKPNALVLINDFEWLRTRFNEIHGK